MDRHANPRRVRGVYGAERPYGFSLACGHGAPNVRGRATEHGALCASVGFVPVREE